MFRFPLFYRLKIFYILYTFIFHSIVNLSIYCHLVSTIYPFLHSSTLLSSIIFLTMGKGGWDGYMIQWWMMDDWWCFCDCDEDLCRAHLNVICQSSHLYSTFHCAFWIINEIVKFSGTFWSRGNIIMTFLNSSKILFQGLKNLITKNSSRLY